MSQLKDYQHKYKNIHFHREDGVLEMRFHTQGGSLQWGLEPHAELPDAFYDLGRDREKTRWSSSPAQVPSSAALV